MKIQHFLSLKDISHEKIQRLVSRTIALKQLSQRGGNASMERATTETGEKALPLQGKTLALLFTKPSTRTRVSAEAGWAAYGGHPLFLGQNDIQMKASGEPMDVTSRVVSSMVDCIIARLGPHSDLETLAKHSSVPVINALTDKLHPLQILADLATIQETYGEKRIKVAWIGDSNNILNSMLLAYPRLGYHLSIATPLGFPVDLSLLVKGSDGLVQVMNDPVLACKDADVIMTDAWISMGEEGDSTMKRKAFEHFQVSERLGRLAKPDWKFMHCLPRKSKEVDDEVFNGERSLIYTQAQYRKFSVMAVYEFVMGIK